MNRHQPLDRLDFNDQLALNHDVQAIAAIETHVLVNDRKSKLPLIWNARFAQFEPQTFFVSRLEQAGPSRR